MISVVIPVFNSGATMVNECHGAVVEALTAIGEPAEVIYVDDGSSDDTLSALKILQSRDRRVRVVELTANFGQHAAFSAGFDTVRGDAVVTMDVDLQTDPTEIPALLAPLRHGYDFVSGVRMHRSDPVARRAASWTMTRLVASMTGVRLRDVGCPFNAFTADVAKSLSAFGELRRFLKPLAVRVAKSVTEVEVSYRPRAAHHVRTSYSTTRLLRLFMDFLVNSIGDIFAWLFAVGVAVSGLCVLLGIAAVVQWFRGAFGLQAVVACVTATAVAILFSLVALLGDYIQRLHHQTSGRPFYLVKRIYETPAASETTRG